MAGAIVNPAFIPLSKHFDITVVQASYELTVYIVFAGIGPLLTVPLANVYGRRPIYILGNLLAAVTNIGAGYCTTWSGIIATRVFNGIGAGSPCAIGAATICDMYFMHERGFCEYLETNIVTASSVLVDTNGDPQIWAFSRSSSRTGLMRRRCSEDLSLKTWVGHGAF